MRVYSLLYREEIDMNKNTKFLLTSLWASLAISTTAAAADVELQLFHRWPNEPIKSFIDERVAAFEAENPGISVTIDQVLNDSYKDKLRVSLGSSNAPDVFFSWSGEFGYNLIRNETVLPLDTMLESDGDWLESTIISAQVAPFAYQGSLYGLPWQMNGKALFYNTDLFEEAGQPLPSSYEDILASCSVFKSQGVTPVVFSSKQHWAISHWVGTFNERLIDPEVIENDYQRATGEFTDPGYVQALEELNAMVKDCSNPFTNAVDHAQSRSMFLAGRAAMAFLEYGEIRYLEEDANFNWTSTNFPEFERGEGNPGTMQGAPEGYMISSKTEHPEEAYMLLKHLVSGETAMTVTATTGFISPAIGAVTTETASDNQVAAADQLANVDGMFLWLDNALDIRIINTYMNGVQLLLEGRKSAEEVMADVQKTAADVRASAAS